MRVLLYAPELLPVRIFYDRPFGYRRYHVDWGDGQESMFSGLWYKEEAVRKIVEEKLNEG